MINGLLMFALVTGGSFAGSMWGSVCALARVNRKLETLLDSYDSYDPVLNDDCELGRIRQEVTHSSQPSWAIPVDVTELGGAGGGRCGPLDHSSCRIDAQTGECMSIHCVRCPEQAMLHADQFCPNCDSSR